MRCRLVFELAGPRTHSEGRGNRERRWGGRGGTRDGKVGEGNGGEQKGGVIDGWIDRCMRRRGVVGGGG